MMYLLETTLTDLILRSDDDDNSVYEKPLCARQKKVITTQCGKTRNFLSSENFVKPAKSVF